MTSSQPSQPAVTSPSAPLPDREVQAKLALEHTHITPCVAWILVAVFLLTICSVPAIQHLVEIRHNAAEQREQIAQGETPDASLWPQSYEVFGLLPSRAQIAQARTASDIAALLPNTTEIKDYETALEDNSVANQWILPRAQSVLARLGAGNEQAYIGRASPQGRSWLMYRPDVDYLTHPGFLGAATLRARERAGDESTTAAQPDPVKAIVDFKRQLARRGIALIVVVAPVKAMIHPEQLSARFGAVQTALQNASFARFEQALKNAGVPLLDPAPLLIEAKRKTGQAQYLETDTHWTPQAMELVARELAGFIAKRVQLPRREAEVYIRRTQNISNIGDIALMLKLPESQKIFQPQRVTTHAVRDADGEAWYPRRNADVLLLGDSFSNIYSLGGMGWGEAAGFAEQLSFALQRPIDRIAINAGGALSSRQELWKQMKRGRDRLRGKRLVIYEFAARDLLIGDWRLLDLPAAKGSSKSPSRSSQGNG